MSTPSLFPAANQAQIIRANQRDVFHIASLREQMDNLLRTWLGTRRLVKWDDEIELCAKMVYFGLTTRHASQTLGEEYTDIWQQSSSYRGLLSRKLRTYLVILSTIPPFLIKRLTPRLNARFPNSRIAALFPYLPDTLEILSEINLAVFYFCGIYYDLVKRVFQIRHITTIPPNPNITPPSYSVLGVMLVTRLIYRLVVSLRSRNSSDASTKMSGKRPNQRASSNEPTIDAHTVSSVLASVMEEQNTVRAEEDKHTILQIPSLGTDERAARRCTLCLEERTSSCATECGHLFCWSCVMGWGKEKPECPLCRQSLDLTRLLPIYNL